MSKADWLKQRSESISTARKINLDLENIKITVNGGEATAQIEGPLAALADVDQANKNSLGDQDLVKKELEFELIEGTWQIVRETLR